MEKKLESLENQGLRSYLINAWQALHGLSILGKSDAFPIYEMSSSFF